MIFKMTRFTLSSIISVLGYVTVNCLPDNHPNHLSMTKEALLNLTKNDLSKFKSIIESISPRIYDLTAADLAQRGNELFEENKFDDAILLFTEAYNMNPLPLYLTRQALCYERKNDFDTAIEVLKRAVSTNPDNVPAQNDLVQVLFESGKFGDTVKGALLLLKPLKLLHLGSMYAKINKFNEAIQCYNEALRRDNVFALPFYKQRAYCHLKLEDKNAAIDDYRKAYNALQRETDPRIREVLILKPSERLEILYSLFNMLFTIGKLDEILQKTSKLSETDLKYIVAAFLVNNESENACLIFNREIGRFPHWRELKKLGEKCKTRTENSGNEIQAQFTKILPLHVPIETIHQLSSEKSLDVFISYRRINGSPLTRWLRENLEDRGFSVVIDVDLTELLGGLAENILLSITRAKSIILVLTENALDRCMNDEKCQDWVHYEIMIAMHSGCNIIPIMDNFQWPKPEQVPEDMRFIFGLDRIKWVHDCNDQQTCFEKLAEYIRNREAP